MLVVFLVDKHEVFASSIWHKFGERHASIERVAQILELNSTEVLSDRIAAILINDTGSSFRAFIMFYPVDEKTTAIFESRFVQVSASGVLGELRVQKGVCSHQKQNEILAAIATCKAFNEPELRIGSPTVDAGWYLVVTNERDQAKWFFREQGQKPVEQYVKLVLLLVTQARAFEKSQADGVKS